jgi:hypothetical protein
VNRYVLPIMLASAFALTPREARAQQYLIGVSGEVSDGIEMGTSVPFKPARIRARLGADLRVDEFPDDIFCFGLLADLVPRTEFGVDARYARMLGKHFEVNVGGIAYVAPSTLFGPSVDLKYHVVLSPSAALIFGPEVNVFVLGSDLPDGTVFVQTLLTAGIHANF